MCSNGLRTCPKGPVMKSNATFASWWRRASKQSWQPAPATRGLAMLIPNHFVGSYTVALALENRMHWNIFVTNCSKTCWDGSTAELLDGDTIHHALGLDWSGDRTQSLIRAVECAGRSLQWRWLILDEFSMVSAELLAQLELRCRELLRDLSMAKYDRDGKTRPFGGLNVILAGDLYQLPPPQKGRFWEISPGICWPDARAHGRHPDIRAKPFFGAAPQQACKVLRNWCAVSAHKTLG